MFVSYYDPFPSSGTSACLHEIVFPQHNLINSFFAKIETDLGTLIICYKYGLNIFSKFKMGPLLK